MRRRAAATTPNDRRGRLDSVIEKQSSINPKFIELLARRMITHIVIVQNTNRRIMRNSRNKGTMKLGSASYSERAVPMQPLAGWDTIRRIWRSQILACDTDNDCAL